MERKILAISGDDTNVWTAHYFEILSLLKCARGIFCVLYIYYIYHLFFYLSFFIICIAVIIIWGYVGTAYRGSVGALWIANTMFMCHGMGSIYSLNPIQQELDKINNIYNGEVILLLQRHYVSTTTF